MKLVITGGCGFIGSALIRYIRRNTDWTIINIDFLTYAANKDNIENSITSRNYFFYEADICDSSKISEIFRKHLPDKVIHLAAESHVDRSIDNASKFINTNIFGTYNLLEISRNIWKDYSNDKKKLFRFHHVSTDEVYGSLGVDDDGFNENSPYMPSSPYSASKASSDHIVRAWFKTYGFPVLVTNCSNNYGPFQFPEKLIPLMILNALKLKPLPIYGDGLQIRDWLFVDDHVSAIFKVLNEGKIGETYNIGGNEEKTNLEIVKKICQVLDSRLPLRNKKIKSYLDLITHVKDRHGHDRRYAIDPGKIYRELNWEPEHNFDEGITKTIDWYLDNLDWCENSLSKSNYSLSRLGTLE